MTRTLLPVALALLCLFTGCSSMQTSAEYGPGMSFEGLGALYAWSEAAPPAGSIEGTTRDLINQDLERRGFERSTEAPDFVVRFHFSKNLELDYVTQEIKGEEGRMTIELLDARSGSLKWRGTARAPIKPGDTLAVREQRLSEAVRRILGQLETRKRA